MRPEPFKSPAPWSDGGRAGEKSTFYGGVEDVSSSLRLVDVHGNASREEQDKIASSAQRLGPLNWIKAVRQARLPASEKSLCFALSTYIDFDTGEAYPSVQRLADDTGFSPRTVQRGIAALLKRGVLELRSSRTGGRKPDGRGISGMVRLNFEVLRSLDRARLRATKGDTVSAEPRQRVADTPTRCRKKGDTVSPKHTNEQTIEHTTTTTSGTGGGGGGAPLCSGGEQDQTSEQKTSEQILVGVGVLRATARQLAASVDPAVIAAGPAWLNLHGKGAGNPPGLLVSALRDGTIQAWHEQQVRDQRELEDRNRQVQRQLLRIDRVAAYKRIAWSAQAQAEPGKAQTIQRAWQTITAAFPSLDALADAEVIPDEQLFDESRRPGDLMNVVLKHARALLAERAAGSRASGEAVAPPTVSPHHPEGEDAANQQIKDPIA